MTQDREEKITENIGDEENTKPQTPEEQGDKGVDREQSLMQEVQDLQDKYLRTMAELDNSHKRSEKLRIEVAEYAVSSFAKALLPVIDNFERAFEFIDKKDIEDEKIKNFLEGIEMTHKEFVSVLSKFNIKEVGKVGDNFDPNFHEALFEVENKKLQVGQVAQVLQRGYLIGERLLRPAKVGIVKK